MRDIYIPSASDAINAFETGRQSRMADDRNNATRRAGGLMASGDYKGAAAALYPYDMATGAKVDEMGRAVEAQNRRTGYGKQLAEGHGDQAAADALASGDWEVAGQIKDILDAADEKARARAKANAERVAGIVAPLGDIPESDMPARKAYIQAHRAELIAAGYSEQQLDAFEPTDANLVPIYVQAVGVKDYLTGRREDRRIDLTGQTLEETKRHNQKTEANAAYTAQTGRMSFEERKRQRGFGTPGYGDDDLSGLSTADLLAAAGLPPAKQ